jgi:hypothetical protein
MARYTDIRRRDRRQLAGKEIFEIKPVILGGSPTDPANKTVLTRQQHIEAVRYWNKVISDLRKQQSPQ